jgi:hypothetical protein
MKMKKQYIQPESRVVVINLMGSVLLENENAPIAGSTKGALELESRQFDNRFEDYDDEEDWDWE